jgi:integrase
MRTNPQRGRVYRRCGCRDADGRQLGARCPRLTTNPKHGTWTFAVDMPSPTGKRSTLRRGGFSTKSDAQAALNAVLTFERSGLIIDDKQTVADYLTRWLQQKTLILKPTTVARYTDYITKDLIPAFGAIRLVTLNHQHIAQFIAAQLGAGRGPITVRRCIATLSSALNDAVRQQRLPHNAAKYAAVPRPPKRDRPCWSPSEATRFLRYCAAVGDPLTDLYELIIGTGMRKGEALGLHWGRCPPGRAGPLRPAHPVQHQQLHAGLHRAQDPQQPRLDRPVRPRARRTPAPSPAPARPRAGVHPTRRPATAARVRSAAPPQAHRRSRPSTDPGPRPAALRRHHHVELAGTAGHGVQDAAPLNPVDHDRDLRPPAQARRARRRTRDRNSPRKGRRRVARPHCDHKWTKTTPAGLPRKVNPLVIDRRDDRI